MEKQLVFSLFVLLVAGISKTNAECERSRRSPSYLCTGGQLSDLDKIPNRTSIILIDGMKVTKLPADALTRFGNSLARFKCSDCSIEEIDPDAFETLGSLQQLILNNNHLTNVKADWFRGLANLMYLDLSYNDIKDIEKDVYGHITHVIELRLSGNRIDCIDTEGLSNLKSLETIELTEIQTFKCPQTISKFLNAHKIAYEKDKNWDAIPLDVEKAFLRTKMLTAAELPKELPLSNDTALPINTTPFPHITKPQPIEIHKSGKTLAPTVITEEVDISAVLTTNSLSLAPRNSSTETNRLLDVTVSSAQSEQPNTTDASIVVVTPIPQEHHVNVTSIIAPIMPQTGVQILDTTLAPIEVSPQKIAEIFYTPLPPPPSVQGPEVLPTPGEQPIGVIPLDNHSTNNPPGEIHAAQSHNSQDNGPRVNGYLFGIFVATFWCSFL